MYLPTSPNILKSVEYFGSLQMYVIYVITFIGVYFTSYKCFW